MKSSTKETENQDHTYKVIWEVDGTHPELAEMLREALQEVVDPEIGLSIIDLGLVRNVHIGEDEVGVTMILTTPYCPYGPALLEMTRKKVETTVNKPVMLELGMEMWDFSMMEEGAGADWGLF
jgi:metal-sulfur cluster biosynthetic enzyme